MLFSLTACADTNTPLMQEPGDNQYKSDNIIADSSPNEPSGDAGSNLATSNDDFLDEDGMIDIAITIGNQTFDAKFFNNESARTIIAEMPFSLDMNDYASQEKVTELSFSLPLASAETPATINAGEIYLWSGNSLVLFYTTFSNSYSYVPVG